MAPRGKTDKFKKWLSAFLTPKAEVHYLPDGPKRHAGPGGFISHAQDFTLHNPTMTSVQGNQYSTTYVQGDRNVVPQIMKLLSDHIILGAAHDDSARVPPPRCHPGTRISLIARITAWFNNENLHELFLWITGPAGVGKSAVVQTFAEYLVEAKLLGASVFCSRPNKRNNPHRIFITIAYQLAIRIPAYREFVVERLSLDPQLLYRDMATQFKTFIIEPFAEKKIEAGGRRWGILLDGLDELEGEDAQCEIIHLISNFIHNHRDAPLVWIIASRPESHISNTFDDDEIRRSCWTEYIPIDSTEACEDVERFLRSSFKTTQKKFRHSTPSDWPSETDFLKLTAAASGLFVYAQVAVHFIRDSDHADPVSRLEALLSVINRSNATPTKENPFIQLDALYHEIISSIPSTLWPTAKQIFAFMIYGERIRIETELRYLGIPRNFQSFRGVSILFGITRHVVYACLNKCRSTLKIPDWKVAHNQELTFLHASFADYLKDLRRSGDFYVGSAEDLKGDVVSRVLEIWSMCSRGDSAVASVESTWHQYCSKWDDKATSKGITKFHTKLFRDVIHCLGPATYYVLKRPTESPMYALLREIHMIELCYYLNAFDLFHFVYDLMRISSKPNDAGLLQDFSLEGLKFGQLDFTKMSPAQTHRGRNSRFSKEEDWTLLRPRSNAELETFISELESLQESSPKLQVTIIGNVPGRRVAVFCRPLVENPVYAGDYVYYAIPYPE